MENWLEMAQDVRGVVFDFGGVISYPPGENWPAYDVAAALGLSCAAFDKGFKDYRHLWDGGFIDGVEMYRRIFADNGLTATDDALRHLLDVDCEGWVHAFNPNTLELMHQLKAQGKKLGILTNMCTYFKTEWFLPRAAEYVALADALVVSGDHRLYKPEEPIYRLMEREIGLKPEELLFFDDNMPNVEGARRCGWKAALFKSA